ncbi:unnamed protein product [Phyllotreta striolata]|uniref:CHK kinase-like domain-containing protein n=1 Tax=Phyllotreta striolata TaxID=444603 RepID=A0A9N9TRL7_PHYSR|nr:unnamed protein product [Phyllotreta striolata]
MSSLTDQDIQKWVDEIMAKKGINNYKLDIANSSAKGEGYLGEISFVKVTTDEGRNDEKVYDMVVKSAKENDKLRESCPIAETYLREIQVYAELFPIIEALQKEYCIKNAFTHYPKLYKVNKEDKKETLILQNIKSLGYELHERSKPQNFEHILFVFRTYAKFHGASLALKAKKPHIFEKLASKMSDIMAEFLIQSQMIPNFQKHHQKSIELLRKAGRRDLAEKMEEEAKDLKEILTTMTLPNDREAEAEAVFLHGDCWNNNMMFKYKDNDTSRPSDIVFLDFQLTRVASPILDLSYYIYAVADKPALDNIDYFLEEYHRELGDYLRQYKINVEDMLTLRRLKASWRKYGRYGLGMTPFILRVELCKEDEVIDFTDKIADGSIQDEEIGEIQKQDEYNRRILNIYRHFSEKFLS